MLNAPTKRGSVLQQKGEQLNLQELIEESTGIPIKHQHLWLGSRKIDTVGLNSSQIGTLRQQGINHGDTLHVTVDHFDVHEVKQHVLEQARTNQSSNVSWVMPRWQHQPCPRLLEGEGMRLGQSVYFH